MLVVRISSKSIDYESIFVIACETYVFIFVVPPNQDVC